MMIPFVIFLLLCACRCFGLSDCQVSAAVVESLPCVPETWTRGEKPSPLEMLRLRLAVHQPAMADLHHLVLDVSTPDHPSYGKHLSKREVDDMLRPARDVTVAITDWLQREGVPSNNIEDMGHWITFNVSVEVAEKLLNTEFHQYHHDNLTLIRTLQYSIPETLRGLIDMIQPTTRFGQPRPQVADWMIEKRSKPPPVLDPKRLTTYSDEFCNSTITPACLRGIYNMDGFSATPSLERESKLGISGFLYEGAYFDDLETFLHNTSTSVPPHDFSLISINNGTTDQHDVDRTLEGNLDVQYAVSLAPGSPVVFYSTGGRAPMLADLDQPTPALNGSNEPYLDQLLYLLALNNSDLPLVLSTSYGEDEQSVPYEYALQVCNLFAQLGVRGVSVIFSSGDTGVGSACQSNDGKNTPQFSPSFPATCPWVTAVGGTYAVNPEIAAAFSSGGFSFYFPQPSYQASTMTSYLQMLGDKNKGYFNPAGRGYPDVSAQSVRYYMVNQGRPQWVYGTSCAAPTFAAIISNLNNQRLVAGISPLGFLNAWLYSTGYVAFNDITHGHSRGCSGIDMYTGQPTPKIDDASWDAVPGWDPVTGWGTPDFPKLSSLLG